MFDAPSATTATKISVAALLLSCLSLAWQVYSSVKERRRKVVLIQQGTDVTNAVFSTEHNATGVILELSIINNSSRAPVVIRHFDLELPWRDDDFDFLPDPKEVDPQSECYSVFDTTITFPRTAVLNHKRYDLGRMEPGETLRGLLLARGLAPIPLDFQHGDHGTDCVKRSSQAQ